MPKPAILILAALPLLCLPAFGATAPSPADAFFGADKVYDLYLHLTEADWQLMQPTRRPRAAPLIADSIPNPALQQPRRTLLAPDPLPPAPTHDKKAPAVDGDKMPPNNFGWEYVYVKAAFECDGQKLTDVAVRFKGNSSYDNYQHGLKRPLKIDFNRFVPSQKFVGLDTLNLGNNAFDTSQLREALSYEVYRRGGVPAPRTAFANLYLTVDGRYDREFVGLYTLIEEIDDKPFLKHHFGNSAGLVLKPEGIRGLPYMGENWDAYAQRDHPKTSQISPEMSRRFIDFLKLVNYADDAAFNAQIADYLNVDDFLRYLAATVLISNLDSPLVTNHNFYFYENPADKKVWLLPWDMNLSFAGYGTAGPRDDQVNLSIAHPWAGENKIFKRVMAIKKNDDAYRQHLRDFIDGFFNTKTMLALINTMQTAIETSDQAAERPRIPDTQGPRFGSSRYTLSEYIPRRVESVLAQLDGKDVAVLIPHPNPPNMNFRWGINASPEFGSLPNLAQAIRKSADADGDYQLTGRELRDAAADLFYQMVNEDHPESLSETELTAALTPRLRDFAPQSSRGFFGFNRGAGSAAALWAKAIFRQADTDNDGKLTLAEVTNLADRLACLADHDQNSRLDEREIIEALDMLVSPQAASPEEAFAPRPAPGNQPPAQRNGRRALR